MSDSEADSGGQLDATAAQSAAHAIKTQRCRAGKRDLRKSGPLKAGLQSNGSVRRNRSSEEAWLRDCEQLYSKLPKKSRYAQHKLKVLSKAIELLKKDRVQRTAEEADELHQLLKSLKIAGAAKLPSAAPVAAAAVTDVAMCES